MTGTANTHSPEPRPQNRQVPPRERRQPTRYSGATTSTTGARRTSAVCGRSIVASGGPGKWLNRRTRGRSLPWHVGGELLERAPVAAAVYRSPLGRGGESCLRVRAAIPHARVCEGGGAAGCRVDGLPTSPTRREALFLAASAPNRRFRTRDRPSSTVMSAPTSSAGARCRMVAITRGPSRLGVMSCVRAWTTLSRQRSGPPGHSHRARSRSAASPTRPPSSSIWRWARARARTGDDVAQGREARVGPRAQARHDLAQHRQILHGSRDLGGGRWRPRGSCVSRPRRRLGGRLVIRSL